MCHYYEGYHTTLASEIEAREFGGSELREKVPYDLPWRPMAVFVLVVGAIGMSLNLIINLLH
jgi:hypothetical protein